MEDTIVLIKDITEKKSNRLFSGIFSDSSVSNCSYNLALG